MLRWIRRRRRGRLLATPFPREWEFILEDKAPFLSALPSSEAESVRRIVRVLVSEKNWEGCGGLHLSDEHRVTIAAQVARMVRYFDNEYFEDVRSVLIYPDAYVARSQEVIGPGVVVESDTGRLGEAWHRGPVILAWADVLATVRLEDRGSNVVIHEFAHQLDMRNGSHADGVPPLESARFAKRWVRHMTAGLERLRDLCDDGIPCLIDSYAATNAAEFFAVLSEVYFEQPEDLQIEWPEQFELLDAYYRQDFSQ